MSEGDAAEIAENFSRTAVEYEFGSFRLILQPHDQILPARLLRDGTNVEEITKSRLACRLLVYLLKKHETPSSTKEVMEHLWPDWREGDRGDQHRSFTAVVEKLRTILGDKTKPHSYIQRGDSAIQFIYRPVRIGHNTARTQETPARSSEPAIEIKVEETATRLSRAKVVICHSDDERDIANALAADLRASSAGALNVRLVSRLLSIPAEAQSDITNCDHLLTFLTTASSGDQFVWRALGVAQEIQAARAARVNDFETLRSGV